MTAKTDTAPIRAELETVAQPTAQKNVIDLIDRNEPELQKLLGKSLTVEQFKTAALTYLRLDPKLLECNPYSIVGGLRLGAQLGLSLGPLGHFYLVPFKQEAVFILGYKGMIELAYRSGKLKRIKAVVVREGDLFDYEDGTKSFLRYKHLTDDPEAPWTHVWALAELTNGGKPFEVLTPPQVEKRKDASPAAKSPYSIWQTHPEQAWIKSSVRALQRWLPQTPESAHGLETDETVPDLLADDVQEVGDEA